jgi:PleD family two-component response regulator
MSQRILIIEDSRTVITFEQNLITQHLRKPTLVAKSFKEASEILKKDRDKIFIALVDIHLPDANNGEAVDLVLAYNLPTIVFTGTYDKEIRKEMMEKNILTYLTKDPMTNFYNAIKIIKQLDSNSAIKIMIVDDSKTARTRLHQILDKYRFHVLEANDGKEAYALFTEHPDTTLILTDQNMPNMSGVELTKKIRSSKNRDEVAIIGISDERNKELTIEFLKSGCNDFIARPFVEEEFITRVQINLETQAAFRRLNALADKE